MLGIKSQPLDDGEVPLFMSFCTWHRGDAKWFPLRNSSKIPSNFIFNQLPYFSTFFNSVFGPKKKSFKVARNWSSNFKHLAIVSLQTWAKILLATGFSTFRLGIQTWISWASDIKIKWFRNQNSSTRTGLQLLWRIQSKIKSFWRTKSGRKLDGRNGSLDLIWKLTMPNIPI
jgi:hypothetical protein